MPKYIKQLLVFLIYYSFSPFSILQCCLGPLLDIKHSTVFPPCNLRAFKIFNVQLYPHTNGLDPCQIFNLQQIPQAINTDPCYTFNILYFSHVVYSTRSPRYSTNSRSVFPPRDILRIAVLLCCFFLCCNPVLY